MHQTEIQLLEEGPPPVKTEPPDSFNDQLLSSTPSSAFSNINKRSFDYRPLQSIAPRPIKRSLDDRSLRIIATKPILNMNHDVSILPENLDAQGATIKMAVTKIKEDPDRYTVRESK